MQVDLFVYKETSVSLLIIGQITELKICVRVVKHELIFEYIIHVTSSEKWKGTNVFKDISSANFQNNFILEESFTTLKTTNLHVDGNKEMGSFDEIEHHRANSTKLYIIEK